MSEEYLAYISLVFCSLWECWSQIELEWVPSLFLPSRRQCSFGNLLGLQALIEEFENWQKEPETAKPNLEERSHYAVWSHSSYISEAIKRMPSYRMKRATDKQFKKLWVGNQDFRFSNIELRGWEICPQSFSWINRTPDITGFPPLLYLKKVTTNFKSCKHCLLWNLSISHFTSWYDMVWREKPGSMHELGRSICYHSRDYGPNWTLLSPITITNLQTQGGHRLQYEKPDFC